MNNLIDVFFFEKPYRLLITVREHTNLLGEQDNRIYIAEISRKSDTTYSYTKRLLDKFEDLDLIEQRKRGRKKEIKLTKKGEKLADKIREVVKVCEEIWDGKRKNKKTN